MALLGTFAESALAGRCCIVTGAASGQGRAVALRFAEAGARVLAVDVNAAGLAETVASALGDVQPLVADLAEPDCGRTIVDAAVSAFGRLDALLNCAALAGTSGLMGAVEDTPLEVWERGMAVNLRAIYLLCQAAIPHLRAAGGGSIINWSSGAAYRNAPSPTSHTYAASKGAIISLSRAMAVRYGKDRIRVNVVVPGLIVTPMTEKIMAPAVKAIEAGWAVPLGRAGVPDDVAGLALFLVSSAASFITGAEFFVDGGGQVEQRFDAAVRAAG